MRGNKMFSALFASTLIVGGAGAALAQTEAPSDALQQAQQDLGAEPSETAPETPAQTPPSDSPPGGPTVAPDAPANTTSPLDGYTETTFGAVTVDELKGVEVYDSAGEEVATISDLEVGPDGNISRVIMDVGGVLGVGAKPVALTADQITLYRNAEDQLRGSVSLGEDALRELPEHEATGG